MLQASHCYSGSEREDRGGTAIRYTTFGRLGWKVSMVGI
jgi:hypothetical protein